MESLLKGILLGFILVLPGMSGGTVFVILGMYEQLVKDIAKFNLKPYYKLFLGVLIGFFLSGSLLSLFFETYRNETAVFLLGCLLASVRAVLKDCPTFTRKRLGFLIAGVVLGFILGSEPIGISTDIDDVSKLLLFLGGALSSATMVIPGLPGSSVLIAMGLYDNVLFYLSNFVILKLLIFAAGSLLGMLMLVNVLEKLYDRYRAFTTYSFAGLIIGSSRALVPESFTWTTLFLFIIGFTAVWNWSKSA